MSATVRGGDPDCITKTEGVLGGQPRVAGTRISVLHIVYHVLYDKHTVDEVAYDIYSDLTVDEVEAAIAHYLTHREEMEEWEWRQQRKMNGISGFDDMPISPGK